MTQLRYLFLALAVLISLHYILALTNDRYNNATSFSNLKDQFAGNALADNAHPDTKTDSPSKAPASDESHIKNNATGSSPSGRKANAVIVMLARNGDLNGVIVSMKQMEDRFNKRFSYPYVFLNEEPFSEDFKTQVKLSNL